MDRMAKIEHRVSVWWQASGFTERNFHRNAPALMRIFKSADSADFDELNQMFFTSVKRTVKSRESANKLFDEVADECDSDLRVTLSVLLAKHKCGHEAIKRFMTNNQKAPPLLW